MANTDENFYKYEPSHALAIIGAILFFIVLVGHSVQLIRFRTWYMWVLLVSPALEVIGFIARSKNIFFKLKKSSCRKADGRGLFVVPSAENPTEKGPGIVSSIGLILPPVFNCACLYMIFGRLIAYVGNKYSFLKGSLVAIIFVLSDIITFLVQIYGATSLISSDTGPKVDQGRKILLGGLILQLVSFGIFALAVLIFHRRTAADMQLGGREQWRPLIIAIHLNSVLILIRSVFRILEFGQVINSLQYHEFWFYIFDSLLILIATALLVVYHPGKYIPRNNGAITHSSQQDIPMDNTHNIKSDEESQVRHH
ncbi:hypothetical protein HKX48_002059 [Thoreauomyces humboldtii]|nr:hypothetical protein HKX48_002059 [Thoreauomyces humboldtii]